MTMLEVVARFAQETLSLGRDRAFFSQTQKERLHTLKTHASSAYPEALRTYLAEVTIDQFVQEMRAALAVITSGRIPQEFVPNNFWTACAYGMREQIEELDHPELVADLQNFVERVSPLRFSFVQTPITLSPEERRTFRASLLDQQPNLIPLFSIEPSLGGGVRVFQNGVMTDRSWTGMATRTLDALFAH